MLTSIWNGSAKDSNGIREAFEHAVRAALVTNKKRKKKKECLLLHIRKWQLLSSVISGTNVIDS
jgi:hypothetical protein